MLHFEILRFEKQEETIMVNMILWMYYKFIIKLLIQRLCYIIACMRRSIVCVISSKLLIQSLCYIWASMYRSFSVCQNRLARMLSHMWLPTTHDWLKTEHFSTTKEQFRKPTWPSFHRSVTSNMAPVRSCENTL